MEATAAKHDKDLDTAISQFLELDETDEAVVDAFWQKVKTNLQAKKIRLIFVADEIPPSLRRIVEFLNEQMDPTEVLAVELQQYVGDGIQTIVPRLIGQTANAQTTKGGYQRETREWNEGNFFTELAQHGKPSVTVAQAIMVWAKKFATEIHWGKGTVTGAFVPTYVHQGKNFQLFAVLTSGKLELYLAWHRQKRPFDNERLQQELITKFNQMDGVSLPFEAMQRQPKFKLTDFSSQEQLTELLSVYEWMIEVVQREWDFGG